VHTEEIYGSSTEYDALWFVNSAKHWYWGSPYSWTAFVRPPSYPLFIALAHFCGIPLRIAIELVQMGGFLVLIAALRKAAVPRVLCLLIFALMVLHPGCLKFNNYSLSDSFYTAILSLALGGLLLTLFTKKIIHAVWTGVAFAVLWNAREESFLIPIILALSLGLAFFQPRSAAHSRKVHAIFWLKRMAVIGGMLFLVVTAVYAANYRVFRSFAKSDMSSPGFEAILKALLRIKPTHVQRYIAFSNEAIRMAYEVSPTFAQLKPEFEGQVGRNWQRPAFDTRGIDEYGPWFMWALRNVTANTGFYRDPELANRFYRDVAGEINRACDERRVPSRFVLSSFLDPGAISRIRYLPRSIPYVAKMFLLTYEKSPVRDDTNLAPWMRSLYEEICFRRPAVGASNATIIPATVSAALAIRVQTFVGDTYHFLVMGLALASLAALLVLVRYFRRLRMSDAINTTLLLLAGTIASRFVFFAFLHATWWPDLDPRYLLPVMPLSTCFFILLIYQAIAIVRRPVPA